MKYDITIRVDVAEHQEPEDVAESLLRYGDCGLNGWGGDIVAIEPAEADALELRILGQKTALSRDELTQ